MLIFLDTEFTDFIDCDLISIGMVTEDGRHLFYAERSDYRRDWENEFVKGAVLPYLGKRPEAICTRDELRLRLWAWFDTLPRKSRSRATRNAIWTCYGTPLAKVCRRISIGSATSWRT